MIDSHEVGTPRLRPLVAPEDMTAQRIEAIAFVCHETNRAYCLTLGDDSQQPWAQAPEWQRESARTGVRGILEGRITKPQHSHESWMFEKLADGWTYGPVKDPELKQHPCIVAYGELAPEQRQKDALFLNVVRAMVSE